MSPIRMKNAHIVLQAAEAHVKKTAALTPGIGFFDICPI